MPIPHRKKFPVIPWLGYQQQLAPADEVERWIAEGSGIGVVCGEVSNGLVCLDFDDQPAYYSWAARTPQSNSMPTARSQRGFHVFYRAKGQQVSGKLHFNGHAVGDVLSNGKLVVLPPTIHPNGFVREWEREPFDNLPFHDLEELGLETRFVEVAETPDGKIAEGSRHSFLVKEALRLAKGNAPASEILWWLSKINREICSPPVEFQELGQIAAWALGVPLDDSRSHSHINQYGRNEEPLLPPEADSLGNDDWESIFIPAEEYLKDEASQEWDWLVEDLLPKQFLVVWGGSSKSGKSCMVTALAHAVSTGQPFLGKATEQTGVLWCAFEESKVERTMVLREFGDEHPNLVLTHRLPPIDKPVGLEMLRRAIEHYRPGLIVIDPLYGAHSQESLAGGTAGRNCLEGIKRLCAECNVAAIVIHHFTKNVGAGLTRERLADSNQITATASMDILMDSTETEEGNRLIRLKGKGRGGFANFDWRILSTSITDYELMSDRSAGETEPGADDLICACLQEAISPLTANEVHERTGIPLATVRNTFTFLKKAGRLLVERVGREYAYELAT